MLAGPEIARVVGEFEDTLWNEKGHIDHHEEAIHVQSAFSKDVQVIVTAFEEHGNPFLECTTDLLTLDTKRIMDASIINSIRTARDIGFQKYGTYVKERILESRQPITDIIKKTI